MNLDRRAHEAEKLDAPWHDDRPLAKTLDHLVGVNRWLGGARVVATHLWPLLPRDGAVRVLDVGTGSADIPRMIARQARARRRGTVVYAVDLQRQVVRLARRASAATREVMVIAADGSRLPLPGGSVDVAITSLTLHHLGDERAVGFVRELARVARHGVIVNDLERHRLNYVGAKVLAATWWRRSPYRHDGPLSVRRAFRPSELLAIGREAGLRDPAVHRHFPYRLALVGRT